MSDSMRKSNGSPSTEAKTPRAVRWEWTGLSDFGKHQGAVRAWYAELGGLVWLAVTENENGTFYAWASEGARLKRSRHLEADGLGALWEAQAKAEGFGFQLIAETLGEYLGPAGAISLFMGAQHIEQEERFVEMVGKRYTAFLKHAGGWSTTSELERQDAQKADHFATGARIAFAFLRDKNLAPSKFLKLILASDPMQLFAAPAQPAQEAG